MAYLLGQLVECLWVMFVVLTIHEFGHFFAAYYLGLPVSSVEMGVGPRIFQFLWKGIWFRLYLFPLFGFVRTCWLSKKRWKNILMFSAGPLANFATAFLLYLVFGEGLRTTHFELLFYVSFFTGAFNLLPIKFRRGDSDGRQILLAFNKRQHM